jgi:hypothetical protein
VQERILEVRHDRPPVRPCPPSRPRGPASSRHLVGLLTHELGQPHAFSPRTSAGGGRSRQWLECDRPPSRTWFPRPENRPNTAAGPSRTRTGVPCLPFRSSGFRPATRVKGGMYRLGQDCQASRAPAARPARLAIAAAADGKPCRLRAPRPSRAAGRAGPRRTSGRSRSHGIVSPTRTASRPRKKTNGHLQAGS